jgi:hypothetical protein
LPIPLSLIVFSTSASIYLSSLSDPSHKSVISADIFVSGAGLLAEDISSCPFSSGLLKAKSLGLLEIDFRPLSTLSCLRSSSNSASFASSSLIC